MTNYNSIYPFGERWWKDKLYTAGYRGVASIVDDIWMLGAIKHFFTSQKGFADFLGVKAPTVNNWISTKTFPEYAKRLLANTLIETYRSKGAALELVAQKNKLAAAKRPLVVSKGDTFSILSRTNEDSPPPNRKVLATNVPTLQDALNFAGADEGMELIHAFCLDCDDHSINFYDEIVNDLEDVCYDGEGVSVQDAADVAEKKLKEIFNPLHETFSAFRERYTDPKILQDELDAQVDPKTVAKLAEILGDIDESRIGINYPPISNQEWRAAFNNACTTPPPAPHSAIKFSIQKGKSNA